MSDTRPCNEFLYEYGKAVYYNELDKVGKRDHPLYDKVARFVQECLLSLNETYEEWVEGERDAESLDSEDSWSDEDDESHKSIGREDFGSESEWDSYEEDEESVGEKRVREDDDVSVTDAKRSRRSESVFTDQVVEQLLKNYCDSL